MNRRPRRPWHNAISSFDEAGLFPEAALLLLADGCRTPTIGHGRNAAVISVPQQVAADSGYASKHNLAAVRQAGVEKVALHKKRRLEAKNMARWVYRKLRNFTNELSRRSVLRLKR